MQNPFAKKSRQEFVEYASMWVEFVKEIHPDDDEIEDLRIFLNNVVKHSEEKITEQHNLWMTNIKTPLNPKKTKYAKAIERITKLPATVYHAIMYRDIDAVEHCIESEICRRMNIFEKYRAATESQRLHIWKFMEKISHSAFEAAEESLPIVPTRAEIQANIRLRTKEKQVDDGPSMTRAFQTHINALCRLIGAREALDCASDDVIREFMVRWNDFARDSTDGERNSTLCQKNDVAILKSLTARFPELTELSTTKLDEKVWRNINQLNGFSSVAENIPTHMMGRIENVANKLADDIVSGRTDMASVNLSDIGQQVLTGCSEEEMSKFASNIEELLPALQSFQR